MRFLGCAFQEKHDHVNLLRLCLFNAWQQIIAAISRLDEEYAAAMAVPPTRPAQGIWVLSTRPRPMQPLPTTRAAPTALGWSVMSEDGDGDA